MLGIVIACTLSVILASGIYVYAESSRLKEAMSREMDTLSSVVANNTLGALGFEDVDSATEVLNSLKANTHIIGAVIYSVSGDVFATYDRSGTGRLPSGFPGSSPATGHVFTDDFLGISRELSSDGTSIGDIYIRVDLEEMNSVQDKFLTVAFVVVVLSIIFAVLLSLIIVRSVVRPINHVVMALRDISEGEGDLTQRLEVNSDDEIGELATCFNSFVERIHEVVIKFRDMSEQLASSAADMSATTVQTSRGVEDQQAEIDQVVSAITQMAGTVQEVTRNIASAAQDTELADQQAVSGRGIVEQTMESIAGLAKDVERAAEVVTELRQESQNIGTVLEVIGSIAEQTNLLALNAAIEAARAGEHSRGFAVVADEVRTLASRTQTSTQEIQQMIDRLQTGANEAVTAMDKGRQQAAISVESATNARDSLQDITSSVKVIKDMTLQIASASEEQSAVTDEINKSVVNISEVACQTSEGSRIITAGSGELARLSDDLKGLINQFKL
jgi:methyl-accepting chemotaxis protein